MNNSKNSGSADKLMLAAINLIAVKGYNGVTTQEIARTAGLSEKTLFRHFGSKRNLLEMAFDRFHYAEEMTKLFQDQLVWDLQTDLLLISQTYHEIMNRNRKLIMISIKEENNLPGFQERAKKSPQKLLRFLTNYFKSMYEKEKLIKIDPETQALSFMMMNFGAFMNNLESDMNFQNVSMEKFITESVQLFTRALTP
ncbi:TetR/AcrR family transcriptional regulator [Metabacillus halosaccharovorans]|uniref:TetR/AcrR family transcriptional regulator n=1 Tax=Metabacillus halosaccharovorans TaxID=930124 RepID=UPI0009952457|nr:TetR/AcrR family transcriptional regulator [Metabacillus halosaccharovorans]